MTRVEERQHNIADEKRYCDHCGRTLRFVGWHRLPGYVAGHATLGHVWCGTWSCEGVFSEVEKTPVLFKRLITNEPPAGAVLHRLSMRTCAIYDSEMNELKQESMPTSGPELTVHIEWMETETREAIKRAFEWLDDVSGSENEGLYSLSDVRERLYDLIPYKAWAEDSK